jgi:hypothetical protein
MTSSFTSAMSGMYDEKVARIVKSLHDIADRVEREGRAHPNVTRSGDPRPDYLNAASGVIHEVTWGLANLNLDGLVSMAADVHHARELEAAQNVAAVLAAHQIRSHGMTSGSADTCACGERVVPERGDEDVEVRRAAAFARHQADALSKAATP